MTDRLKDELNLDHVYTNELIFKDGKLDGVKINVDSDKAKSARIKIQEWNIPKDEIVDILCLMIHSSYFTIVTRSHRVAHDTAFNEVSFP